MSKFAPLNLPKTNLKITKEGDIDQVFDQIRKKYIVLTPEEWVRQHFIAFMINYLHYPKSLVKIESGHQFNTRKKRTDIIQYNRQGKPFMLIECKSVDVQLDQKTLDQVSLYNQTIQAPFLAITNGKTHFIFQIDFKKKEFTQLDKFPSFQDY